MLEVFFVLLAEVYVLRVVEMFEVEVRKPPKIPKLLYVVLDKASQIVGKAHLLVFLSPQLYRQQPGRKGYFTTKYLRAHSLLNSIVLRLKMFNQLIDIFLGNIGHQQGSYFFAFFVELVLQLLPIHFIIEHPHYACHELQLSDAGGFPVDN